MPWKLQIPQSTGLEQKSSRRTGENLKAGKKIKSGFVAINGMHKSDPRLPFGGIKNSGIGRELSH